VAYLFLVDVYGHTEIEVTLSQMPMAHPGMVSARRGCSAARRLTHRTLRLMQRAGLWVASSFVSASLVSFGGASIGWLRRSTLFVTRIVIHLQQRFLEFQVKHAQRLTIDEADGEQPCCLASFSENLSVAARHPARRSLSPSR